MEMGFLNFVSDFTPTYISFMSQTLQLIMVNYAITLLQVRTLELAEASEA